MSSRMSSSFALLYVRLVEQEIILNTTKNQFLPFISTDIRYINDVCYFQHLTGDKLKEFHNFMNIQNPHLKFAMTFDSSKLNFLDVLILNNDCLSTSLYRKPLDRNSLLHKHITQHLSLLLLLLLPVCLFKGSPLTPAYQYGSLPGVHLLHITPTKAINAL